MIVEDVFVRKRLHEIHCEMHFFGGVACVHSQSGQRGGNAFGDVVFQFEKLIGYRFVGAFERCISMVLSIRRLTISETSAGGVTSRMICITGIKDRLM